MSSRTHKLIALAQNKEQSNIYKNAKKVNTVSDATKFTDVRLSNNNEKLINEKVVENEKESNKCKSQKIEAKTVRTETENNKPANKDEKLLEKMIDIKRENAKYVNKKEKSDKENLIEEEQESDFEEIFESSGSEYIPDTSDESDQDTLNDNMLLSNLTIDDTSKIKTESGKNKANNLVNIEAVINIGDIQQTCDTKIEQFSNVRPWTKKNTCPYCFHDVTHFPRHLQRNHKDESLVQKYLSMSSKDCNKKILLNSIRRQGNFSAVSHSKLIRPVRRPKNSNNSVGFEENLKNKIEKYVPCPDCLGYFKRNYLRRHRKCCTLRSDPILQTREQHLSASQLYTICSSSDKHFYSNLRLKNEVFPFMRNDEISKIAMKDVLICSYAETLLKKHKRAQIKNVISNKMRELGRLLLTLQNTTKLKNLFDFLRPQFFDELVLATKIISGYIEQTRSFKAGSLALHMGTTLKQVCSIAIKMVIKKSPLFSFENQEEILKDIKRLRTLIEDHWNSELSSLALKTLNEKRYQNPKLLPLTQDVMSFQKFVLSEANKAYENLKKSNQMKTSFRKLTECTLALTLLLNRKRIGEIQYLKTNTYNRIIPQNLQEEILQSLSETEKTLTKNFKRVVTDGKGSKPVAILFPSQIQQYIEILLKVRCQYVTNDNPYLFANPNTKTSCLSGYHTMKKLAENSGVANKSLFTSTRLRKQIATVLQVLNIGDDEMEQFANFMGHTRKTHESFYRLPQDIYQTAKVAKLLLAVNKGNGAKYKGKTLDEINFSLSEQSGSEDEISEYASNGKNESSTEICISQVNKPEKSYKNTKKKPALMCKKNIIGRVKWTEEQKKVISEYFKYHIQSKKAPKKYEVESLINEKRTLFEGKNWVKIKAYVYNCYKK